MFGVGENGLRKQLLQVRDLPLAICVDMCHAFETTTRHMRVVTGKTLDVVDAMEQSKHSSEHLLSRASRQTAREVAQ